jgi:uncharacterized membrane protein
VEVGDKAEDFDGLAALIFSRRIRGKYEDLVFLEASLHQKNKKFSPRKSVLQHKVT